MLVVFLRRGSALYKSRACAFYGKPEILGGDHGAKFASTEFICVLINAVNLNCWKILWKVEKSQIHRKSGAAPISCDMNKDLSMNRFTNTFFVLFFPLMMTLSSGASASIWQINMNFDNDESAWGVYTHLDGGGYVSNSSANARSGSKSGFVYSFTGWSGIGRNVTVPAYSTRRYRECAAGIYAKGLSSYFEVIDTATWTYLRPLAHTSGSTAYTRLLSGVWSPRQNVYLRYVANAGSTGSFTYSYVDDAVMQCTYD